MNTNTPTKSNPKSYTKLPKETRHTLHIPARYLRALSLLTADSDIRDYLCGVCVEINPNGQHYLIATNGHYLGVIGFSNADDEMVNVKERLSIIIPNETIAIFKKSVSTKDAQNICLPLSLTFATTKPAPETEDERKYREEMKRKRQRYILSEEIELKYGYSFQLTTQRIVGIYPEWRRVLDYRQPKNRNAPPSQPKNPTAPPSMVMGNYDFRYIKRFEMVARELNGNDNSKSAYPFDFFPNGKDEHARITIAGKPFIGLLMPMDNSMGGYIPELPDEALPKCWHKKVLEKEAQKRAKLEEKEEAKRKAQDAQEAWEDDEPNDEINDVETFDDADDEAEMFDDADDEINDEAEAEAFV